MYIHWKLYNNDNILKAREKTKYKRYLEKVLYEITSINTYDFGKKKCIICKKYIFMENMYQIKDGYECKDHSTFLKPLLFNG